MKKIILIFAVAIMTVACTSTTTTNPIVGTWVRTFTLNTSVNGDLTQKMTQTFNSDGTLKINTVSTCTKGECPANVNITGTYTIKGTELTRTIKVNGKDETRTFPYSISGNKLTITETYPNPNPAESETTTVLVYTKQ